MLSRPTQEGANQYLVMLASFIVMEVLALILPLNSFHKSMRTEKSLYLKTADQLSIEITVLQSRLLEPKSVEEDEL